MAMAMAMAMAISSYRWVPSGRSPDMRIFPPAGPSPPSDLLVSTPIISSQASKLKENKVFLCYTSWMDAFDMLDQWQELFLSFRKMLITFNDSWG